jgi:signal transduction histidine kinase
MEGKVEPPAEEIERLRRCINDLVSVLALPAIWIGGGPSIIIRTLLDALLGMLRLDLVFLRLKDPIGEAPIEMIRSAQSLDWPVPLEEIGALLEHRLGADPQEWPALIRNPAGDGDISIVPVQLGLQGEIGVVLAGSRRANFPGQTERLILSVAANQAAIGLQGARLLSEQRRVAEELDQRVARRTAELAKINEELKKEIAERKLAQERLSQEERELKRSEAFLAEAQRLSLTGSFSWRVATDEITWSEQLYRIFEFDQAEPVTISLIRTRIHPEDIVILDDMIERARRAASGFEFEHRLLMPDHTVKHLHLVAHVIRGKDDYHEYIGAVQDVTRRRLSDEELAKARSELARVARVTSFGALTASIAHEVNQPLAGIFTNAGTCLRMLAADPPNVDGARETARRTMRDCDRASDVITRLHALFGKKDTLTEAVDLNAATQEVITLTSSEIQRGRVKVKLEFAHDLPVVTGDRVQLQQVILNLLLNAIDAMSSVDEYRREVVIRTERDGSDHIRLAVQDAGVGIDPQNARKLFEAFYTTKRSGMGIGLSVSRSIIESHQGRIWAAPNDGAGATVSFSIPYQPEHIADVSGPADTR